MANLYAGIPQWSVGTTNITATGNITTNLMGSTLTASAGKNITMTAGGSIINSSAGTVSASQSGGAGGNILLKSNGLTFTTVPTINTDGTVTFAPDTTSTTIGIAGGAGTLGITSGILNGVTAGEVDIGATTDTGLLTANAYTWGENTKWYSGSGGITINGAQNVGGNSFFAETAGASDITFGASGSVTSTATGDAITLASGQNFINNNGSGALSASSGRWLVYSTNPSNDTIGSLSNSFRRFSCTYGGSCPSFSATGNGFLYSYTPTLTITPDAQSATYGDAAPSLSGYSYSASGYLGSDSGNDTLSGSLTGTTNYAQGDGTGSYNINYSSGSLTSALGYGFSYGNHAGGLTVNAKGLTVTADNQFMTVGASVPALTYGYSGLVLGDASASFTGALTTTGTSGSSAGTYPITVGTLAATGNYTIGSFNNGTLTINAVSGSSPTVSTSDVSRILQMPRIIVSTQSIAGAPAEVQIAEGSGSAPATFSEPAGPPSDDEPSAGRTGNDAPGPRQLPHPDACRGVIHSRDSACQTN